MNAERLLKLASFLKTVPPERFNYRFWASDDDAPEWKPEEKIRLSCGTAGCAAGWATAIPEFAALGLSLKEAQGTYFIVFGGKQSYDALERFFDLTGDEVLFIFQPDEDEEEAGPEYVAAKIEKFVQSAGIRA